MTPTWAQCFAHFARAAKRWVHRLSRRAVFVLLDVGDASLGSECKYDRRATRRIYELQESRYVSGDTAILDPKMLD